MKSPETSAHKNDNKNNAVLLTTFEHTWNLCIYKKCKCTEGVINYVRNK